MNGAYTNLIRKIKCYLVFVFLFAGSANAQQIPVWKLADLTKAMKTAQGPTIFNFWATFCKPCLAELPHFQQLANRYRDSGVRLVMISLDLKEAYPRKISTMAKRLKLTSPVVFLDESNADVFCPAVDSTWTGAIPASLFVNPKTGYRRFYEDELTRAQLEAEIRRMLGR